MLLRKIKNSIRNISMKKKLLFSYSLVVLVPVAIVGYFFISGIIRQSVDQTRTANEVSFNQLSSNIDFFFKDYTQLVDNMKSDVPLTEFIKKTYTPDVDLAQRYFDYYFASKSYTERLAYQRIKEVNVLIYTANPHITTDQEFILRMTEVVQNSTWYPPTLQNKKGTTISDPFLNNGRYYIPLTAVLSPESFFTNMVKVEIPESLIYNMIEKESTDKSIYIVNSNYTVISSTDRGRIGQNIYTVENLRTSLPTLQEIEGKTVLESKGEAFFINRLSIRPNVPPLWVVAVVSSRPLMQQMSALTGISVTVTLLVIILDIILIFLFSQGITVRIDRLTRAMGRVKDGKFNISVDYEGKDEISVLARSFKDMLDRTDTLVNEVYTSQLQIQNLELKAKDAEIHALQSQINPHFLFNCLESIKSNVLKGRNEETADIIVSFSRMIRKSCDWKSDLVPLRNEMELLEDYLKIQKFRYRTKLNYQISMAPQLGEILIPKFTLQPLVENAVYHGIEPQRTEGFIEVFTRLTPTALEIIVKDSGAGMKLETLDRIREGLLNWQQPSRLDRIGILNVQQRLKLHYGEAYGLSVDSEVAEGTTVIVTLPLPENPLHGE